MAFTKPPVNRGADIIFLDLEGDLQAVVPLKVQLNVPARSGETFDAVECDVYPCDGRHAGTVINSMWLIGKALQGQLAPFAGTGIVVLGRLVKPDGKRYRILAEPTDDDVALATKTWPELAADNESAAMKPEPARPSTDEDPPF